MTEAIAEAREIDRALNATRDPGTMRALITRRRLIRSGMAFERAIELIQDDHRIRPAAAGAFRRP